MELSPILIVLAVILASGAGRALTVLGRSSDVMASLFVPPDRALGWPHGVQEADAPWSWTAAKHPRRDDERDLPGPAVPVETARLSPSVHPGHAVRAGSSRP